MMQHLLSITLNLTHYTLYCEYKYINTRWILSIKPFLTVIGERGKRPLGIGLMGDWLSAAVTSILHALGREAGGEGTGTLIATTNMMLATCSLLCSSAHSAGHFSCLECHSKYVLMVETSFLRVRGEIECDFSL